MSFHINAKPQLPTEMTDEELIDWHYSGNGISRDGINIFAQWDDENRQCIGWVVPEGAQKYADDNLGILEGWTITIVEDEDE